MRAIKIVGFVIGGLFALLLLAAGAVLLWVDPNDYRGEIEKRAEAAIGRPVKIGGELGLKLFPWLALRVSDVAVGNPPGYGAEPFVSVRRADVGVKLLPLLLHRHVEVRRVTLDGLAANLVSRGDEENNWKDLGEDDAAAQPEEPSAKASIAGVDVTDASLVYRDEAEHSLTRLSKLNLHTGALGGDDPFPVKLDFDYDDGTPDSKLSLTIEARARVPADSSRLELSDLVVKGRPSGTGTEFSVRTPRLALDWESEVLEPATLAVAYGKLPLQVTASGQKILSDRRIVGKIAIARLSLRELLPSLGTDVPKTGDPKALTAFSFNGNYRLTENALALSGLDVRLDATRIRGKLGIEDLDTEALSFDLGVDSIDVDRYLEPDPPAGSGKKKEEPPVDLPRDALRELNARGVLRVGAATLAGMKFRDVRVPVEAAAGRVHVSPQAKLFGGSYQGDILLDARPQQLRLSMNERVRGIDIGALVNAAFDSKRVVGRGDANAVLTGTGNTDAAILESLAGKIDANVRDGAFDGVDLWFELRRAMALVKRTALPARSGPARTPFRTLAGSATLANGVMRNDDLRIDMDYLKARGKGTLAIGNQAVDYRLVAEIYKLPPAGAAGSEMADLKAVEIPMAITGTLADMKVRPDVGDILKARVNKEVDKRKKELKKKLEDKVGDKLKDLLNR